MENQIDNVQNAKIVTYHIEWIFLGLELIFPIFLAMSTISRSITGQNPIPESFTNLSFGYFILAVCGILFSIGIFLKNGKRTPLRFIVLLLLSLLIVLAAGYIKYFQ